MTSRRDYSAFEVVKILSGKKSASYIVMLTLCLRWILSSPGVSTLFLKGPDSEHSSLQSAPSLPRWKEQKWLQTAREWLAAPHAQQVVACRPLGSSLVLASSRVATSSSRVCLGLELRTGELCPLLQVDQVARININRPLPPPAFYPLPKARPQVILSSIPFWEVLTTCFISLNFNFLRFDLNVYYLKPILSHLSTNSAFLKEIISVPLK